jgi:hypothetical protein
MQRYEEMQEMFGEDFYDNSLVLAEYAKPGLAEDTFYRQMNAIGEHSFNCNDYEFCVVIERVIVIEDKYFLQDCGNLDLENSLFLKLEDINKNNVNDFLENNLENYNEAIGDGLHCSLVKFAK